MPQASHGAAAVPAAADAVRSAVRTMRDRARRMTQSYLHSATYLLEDPSTSEVDHRVAALGAAIVVTHVPELPDHQSPEPPDYQGIMRGPLTGWRDP